MALISKRFANNQRLQAAAQNSPPLKRGESDRDAVRLVQEALIELGYSMPKSAPQGEPDGVFGPETLAAVRQFQTDQRLPCDGQAGHDTLHALDRLAPMLDNGALTERAVMMCPHAGPVVVKVSPPAKAGRGPRILVVNDSFTVVGCPFSTPCVRVMWVAASNDLRIRGAKALDARSVGACVNAANVPQGSVRLIRG